MASCGNGGFALVLDVRCGQRCNYPVIDMALTHLIQKSPDVLEYLDGYNGGTDWEWTTDRKTAWRLRKGEAERKAELIKLVFPDVIVIEV